MISQFGVFTKLKVYLSLLLLLPKLNCLIVPDLLTRELICDDETKSEHKLSERSRRRAGGREAHPCNSLSHSNMNTHTLRERDLRQRMSVKERESTETFSQRMIKREIQKKRWRERHRETGTVRHEERKICTTVRVKEFAKCKQI